MRTTVDIDDDVLQAAKELARRERKTTGRILSELARRGAIVTNEMIDQLRKEGTD